ncbi:major facilitator superfamily domain-containing protein [Lactarius deliciosus]|nr:major facilitator superfamily domain-containing protein [Lactarius deliciosus]
MVPLSKVSMVFAAGTALFSDGYANGVIGNVNTSEILFDRLYRQGFKTLTSVAFAGTVVGMLIFGWVSDKIGRKFGMMAATGIVALFSALSAASSGAHHSANGMLAMLCACRFLLGIGVGAEYPCGSVAASEQSEEEGISKNARHRWFALATNTMIDLGFRYLLVCAAGPVLDDHLRAVWRLSLGLGVVPALAVLVWRLNMQNPTHYKKNSMRDTRIPYWLVIKRYWVGLTAISLTWFIYDFITYPFGIYSSTVVDTITGGNTSLTVVFGWATVINLFYMPGTIGGAFIVDYLGPKYTMAIVGFIMSGLYVQLKKHIGAFAVIYGIFLSFGELGPGNCLGLLAAKSGPTAVRGQFYGAAAAIGKIGAFAGTWAFPAIIDGTLAARTLIRGNTGPFWIGSGLAILSALITFFFIRPLTHDGLVEEDRAFREYLESHGYDTSRMGFVEEGEEWSEESLHEKDVEQKDVEIKEPVAA